MIAPKNTVALLKQGSRRERWEAAGDLRKPFCSIKIDVSGCRMPGGATLPGNNAGVPVCLLSATFRISELVFRVSRLERVVLNCRAGGCVLEFLHTGWGMGGRLPLAPLDKRRGEAKPSRRPVEGQFTTPSSADVADASAVLSDPETVNS